MKDERLTNLIKEFQETCQDETEAEVSALFAINLSNAFKQERSLELKENFLNQIKPKSHFSYNNFLIPVLLMIVLFFGFVLKVEASQLGESFYPIKVLTEGAFKQVKTIFTPVKTPEKKTLSNPKTVNNQKKTKPSIKTNTPKQSPQSQTKSFQKQSEKVNQEPEKVSETLDKVQTALDDTANQTPEKVEDVTQSVNNVIQNISPKLGL